MAQFLNYGIYHKFFHVNLNMTEQRIHFVRFRLNSSQGLRMAAVQERREDDLPPPPFWVSLVDIFRTPRKLQRFIRRFRFPNRWMNSGFQMYATLLWIPKQVLSCGLNRYFCRRIPFSFQMRLSNRQDRLTLLNYNMGSGSHPNTKQQGRLHVSGICTTAVGSTAPCPFPSTSN